MCLIHSSKSTDTKLLCVKSQVAPVNIDEKACAKNPGVRDLASGSSSVYFHLPRANVLAFS